MMVVQKTGPYTHVHLTIDEAQRLRTVLLRAIVYGWSLDTESGTRVTVHRDPPPLDGSASESIA